MKVKAPSLLRKIIGALSSKTNELRIRMMIFFLLHKNLDKTCLTNSLQALVSHHSHPYKKSDDVIQQEQQQLVLQEEENKGTSLWMNYNKATTSVMVSNSNTLHYDDEEEEETRADLTHALFKESEAEMEMEGGESDMDQCGEKVVMDKEEEEEDINQAADLFIQRFKRQMLLQKQPSLRTHQSSLLLSNA